MKRELKNGIKFTIRYEVFLKLFKTVFSVYVVRVLDAKSLGIFAVVSSVLALVYGPLSPGFAQCIIADKSKQEQIFLNTAWTIETFLMNFIIGAGLFFTANYISFALTATDDYVYYIKIISLVPIIKAFQNNINIDLQLRLDFKTTFWYKIIPSTISLVVGFILLFLLRDLVVLLYMEVLTVAVQVILGYIIYREFPRFSFNLRVIKELWSFGQWIQLSRILKRSQKPVEKLLINQFFGVELTGLFQVAEKIPSIITSSYEAVVSKVLFPVRAKSNSNSFSISIITRVVVLLITVIVMSAFLIDEYMVVLLFGEDWLNAIPLMRTMLVFLPLVILKGTYGIWWRALKRPFLEFIVSCGAILFSLAILIWGKVISEDSLPLILYFVYFVEASIFIFVVYLWYDDNKFKRILPYTIVLIATSTALFTGAIEIVVCITLGILIPIFTLFTLNREFRETVY
jgi:teichuronic acid exporter